MSDQIEELIREIASKHGIAVARDDPILVLQTINNRLLQDSAAAQQAQLDQFKEELEAVSLRWKADAKDKAERILNASLVASRSAMDQILRDGAHATSELLKCELERALALFIRNYQEARLTALLNMFASLLTIAAVCIASYFFIWQS